MQNIALPGAVTSGAFDVMSTAQGSLEKQIQAVRSSRALDRPGDLKKAAQQFESLFISYLLKVMRETIEESGASEGFGKTIYTELFDEELAKSMAERGALGIADLLMSRLKDQAAGSEPAAGEKSEPTAPTVVPKPPTENNESAALGEVEIPDCCLPVHAPISSAYGMRTDPFTGRKRFHTGIDLAAPAGTQILAPWGGKVASAGSDAGYGNYVVVEHPEGFRTRYAHLGSASVRAGDPVAAGEVLGTVGNSGRSTGPHLHFEVIRRGKSVDPKGALAE